MYRLAPVLDTPPLGPGAVLLLEGPPMSGKASLAQRLLDVGFEAGEPAVVVATKKPASWYREQHGADAPLFVVDCVSAAAGRAVERGRIDDRTYVVSSPADLTGIGIGISQFLDELDTGDEAGADVDGADADTDTDGPEPTPVRFYLDSISTLLAYSTPDQLYRFLHALTSRTRSVGALALCLAHTSGVDESEIARFRSLFDATVETRAGEDGPEVRTRGLDDDATGWRPIQQSGGVHR